MALKTFSVTVPICGFAVVEVEAENEKEAVQNALNSDIKTEDIEQWEALEEIVRGNVFYGPVNKAEAEEV